MYTNTHLLAEKLVGGLKQALDQTRPTDLLSIRSIYLTGSYIRGDWLDSSSDLDITILCADEQNSVIFEKDFAFLRSLAQRILDGAFFPSQCPGGIDWSIQSSIPITPSEASVIGPYPYHSIFLFDLKEQFYLLWGEDVKQRLPDPPDPAKLAAPALDFLLSRLSRLGNSRDDARKAAFAAYKSVLVAQLAWGRRTLHKYRILDLYNCFVPDFALKYVGKRIIRDYLGSFYPDRPPQYEDATYYTSFIKALRETLPV